MAVRLRRRRPSTDEVGTPPRVDFAADFDSVAPEWDDLADSSRAPCHLRPGWAEAWWRAFGRGELAIVTLRRDGPLRALLPCHRRGRALVANANAHTPLIGVVAADLDSADELARAVVSAGFRRVSLAYASPQAAGAFGRAAAERPGCVGFAAVAERSPFVPVGGAHADYEAALDGKLRRDLRRRRRRLEEEAGEIEVDVRDGSEDLEALLDEGFELEASGWKAERGSALISDPRARRFYVEIAEWAVGKGLLRLAFLRAGGRALAFQMALEDLGRWYFLKGGYDPAAGSHAPQKLLVQGLLARAWSEGLVSYEFLGNDEAWKMEWTSSVRRRLHVHVFHFPGGLVQWVGAAYGPERIRRTLAYRD